MALTVRREIALDNMLKRPSHRTTTEREDELLRCCARVTQNEATKARFEQLLSEPLDWSALMCRCWWHRIRPLTCAHLASYPATAEVVPAEIWDQLAAYREELVARNQRLYASLCEVAGLFEQRGLRMLAFKGPILALDTYGDLGLRECGDLDLLVHQEDLFEIIQVLSAHGFTLLEADFEGEATRKTQQVFACEFQRDGVSLDVHWDLVPGWLNYRIDFDRLWEEGVPMEEGGHYARKLRPEDSMVVLSIHGTKHWWERLRWICDIAELVNSQAITDWRYLDRAATLANCRRSVDLGLWLAGELLSASLPAQLRQRLEHDAGVRSMTHQINRWLGQSALGDSSRNVWQRFLFRMRACERTRDRVPQVMSYLLSRSPRASIANR